MNNQPDIDYAMRSTSPSVPVAAEAPPRILSIPIEWAAYAVLIVLFVVLRFAELDTAPMAELEARQAIRAWDAVYHRDDPTLGLSDQPLTFYGQVIGLSSFATSEMGARAVVAVAGIALALLPLLFRPMLNATQTLLLSLIWGLSPVALAASRTSDPSIWAGIFGVLMCWALWRYLNDRRPVDGSAFIVFAVCLVFLSGPYGLVTAFVLLVAGVLTAYRTALNAPFEADVPGDEVIRSLGQALRALPVGRGLPLAGLIVLLAATAFLLRPEGLVMVGAALESGLRALTQPLPGGSLPVLPLLVVAVYELGAVLLGLSGYGLLRRYGHPHVSDRFALLVVLVAALVALFYRGAGPGYALLLVLPLGWLMARVVNEMLIDESTLTYWDLVKGKVGVSGGTYGWVKWMLALLLAAILVMTGTHLQEVARNMLTFAPDLSIFDNLARLAAFPSNGLRSLVWVVMSGLFTIVGAFLVASLWGDRITLQGIVLGLFGFTLVSGLGAGWNAVVARATYPVEIWQSSHVTRDAYLLRDTLHEIANFTARGEPVMRIAVVKDEEIGLVNDGTAAWLLREFSNTRFVSTVAEAAREEIIIMRRTLEEVDLGGSYVGQSFGLRAQPKLAAVPVYDWPAWLAQRRIRSSIPVMESVILWVRLDLYNSVPVDLTIPR